MVYFTKHTKHMIVPFAQETAHPTSKDSDVDSSKHAGNIIHRNWGQLIFNQSHSVSFGRSDFHKILLPMIHGTHTSSK